MHRLFFDSKIRNHLFTFFFRGNLGLRDKKPPPYSHNHTERQTYRHKKTKKKGFNTTTVTQQNAKNAKKTKKT